MGAFLLRRTTLLVSVVVGITLGVFLLIRLIPGDPAASSWASTAAPEALAALHKSMGLDRSLGAQYVIFLKALIRGQLGCSCFFGEQVVDLVLARLRRPCS